MATSQVNLEWFLFGVISTDDDNDNRDDDIISWEKSGNLSLNGWYKFGICGYYNDIIYAWGIV